MAPAPEGQRNAGREPDTHLVNLIRGVSLSPPSTDADPPFDLREQLARIDGAQAYTRKVLAEHDTLAAEDRKYQHECLTILVVASAAAGALLVGLLGHVTIVLRQIGG